jgi:macrolide transport system ATP-binding/permease protein
MAALREWVIRLWATVRPSRRDAELEEELRLHLELATEDERRHANSSEDPGRAAVIRSGGMAQAMEAVRDQRGLPCLDDLARDLRHGLRVLRRNPMFASVAVLTLALGIGANSAIFSLADAVLVRTLPVSNPRDLVLLRQRGPVGDIFPFTSAAAVDLAGSRDVLSGLAAFRPIINTHVGVNGATELALAQWVSGNYHAVLGVHAVVGRTLTEQDREPVAVISHRYWQRRFAGDPTVVGRMLEMQGRSFTIVGVTPSEFFGTQPGRDIDVTAPLQALTLRMPPNARWLYLVGRLAPGVSRDQARAAMRVRWAQLTAAESSRSRPPDTLELDSGAQGLNELRQQFSLPLRILMAAVGVVLIVACANLAGLLIVRSSARQQEIAIRLSLGAARWRIVRQLLTESALLAVGGGAAGVALAYWVTNLLLAMMSRGRGQIVLDITPNARTLAFTAALTIVTAALFGLLPAIGACRTDVQPRLKLSASGADGTRNTWGRAMVAAQVALLVLLLTSAGLFTRTLQKLRSVDAGFRQDQVLVVRVSTGPEYPEARARALYEELDARFAALPGVQSVSMSMDSPGGDLSMGAGITVPGRPADPADAPQVYHNFVGPRFFETMGIPVLAGRDFDVSDDERAPKYVVINDSVARRYFGSEDPLGRQILVGDPRCRRCPPPAAASIVGVVKDVRYASLRADAPLMIYRPYRQEPSAPADNFLIRTSSANVEALTPSLRGEVRAAAPTLPPPSVVSLEDKVAAMLVEERMLAALSSALGALAAILVAIGIYSTVAAAVARRQREIGIRMALGALPGQVARMVVSEAVGIVAGGLSIGVPAAIATALAARALLAGVLFDLSPIDPLTLSSSVVAILVIASLAAYVPARRASRIDPVAAVKYE